MHARSDRADQTVLLGDDGTFAADAALDGPELASVDPLEHVDLPRTSHRQRYDLEISTATRTNHARNRDSACLQRAHPHELRIEFGVRVIAAAMHPQHGAPAVGHVDPEHGILAHLDRREFHHRKIPLVQRDKRQRLHFPEEGCRLDGRRRAHSAPIA